MPPLLCLCAVNFTIFFITISGKLVPHSDDDSDADEITDYLNIKSSETKNEPVSSSSVQPIYSSTLSAERDLNHSSSSCSSSSTNSAHNNHVGRKKTYAALASTAKMVRSLFFISSLLSGKCGGFLANQFQNPPVNRINTSSDSDSFHHW